MEMTNLVDLPSAINKRKAKANTTRAATNLEFLMI